MSDTLLRVEDLKIYYPVAGSGFGKKEFVKAVDGVTFEVKKGEVFGIVGESGCGKSTLGRGVCKLENLTSGHVYLDGEDITEYNDRRMRSIRKKVQMVFQDPYASLNPRMSVFDIIAEPLLVHHLYQDKADLEKKVLDLLHRVGLDDYHANRYPHEFSGGQRQRIGIARALFEDPEVLVLDEATSALDNDTEAAIMESINSLHGHKTLIIIAHNYFHGNHLWRRSRHRFQCYGSRPAFNPVCCLPLLHLERNTCQEVRLHAYDQDFHRHVHGNLPVRLRT